MCGGTAFCHHFPSSRGRGITIGRLLGDYLRERDKSLKCLCPWTVFDKELVDEVLKDHSLPGRLSEFMAENKISEIDDILEELFGLHPAKWVLVKKTSETILHLAQMGHVVLVGRGANVLTRKLKGGFHVRLVGSADKRLEHLKEYYGFNTKTATEFLKKEDNGRKNYLKEYFNKNIDEPLLYDLVINTDGISYEEAARLIAHAALKRNRKHHEKAVNAQNG